jgi:hypothetical protein
MWVEGLFKKSAYIPTEEGYRKACNKMSVESVSSFFYSTYDQACSSADNLYNDLQITILDGSKCMIPRTDETVSKYGLGKGSVGDAYYPQIYLGGFYDLATGTFSDLNFDNGAPAERKIMLDHAKNNKHKTLYIVDAGYNGMAHIYFTQEYGHHLLMELKRNKLKDEFRKSKKRSQVIEVKLKKGNLLNFPKHQKLIGKKFKIRFIRTKGTTKLRSKILVTTLIDEQKYKWLDLATLYIQRWKIELAFRHMKSRLKIEKIKKHSIHRIKQLLWAAFAVYNLCAIIRNRVKPPSLFPEKKNTVVYCFTYIIDSIDRFLKYLITPGSTRKAELLRCFKAIKSRKFLYDPWRVNPRICQVPPSVFTRQKSTKRVKDIEKCNALKIEMKILGEKYGMIDLIDRKSA